MSGAENVERREAWEPVVAELLEPKPNSPEAMRLTLGLLAGLLQNDQLPSSGRAFVADILQRIAAGEDPRKILPPRRSKGAANPLRLMADVERERAKRSAAWGDMNDVYERVARRHGLAPGTVEKVASHGRRGLRNTVAQNINAGVKRDQVVKAIADILKLQPAAVEKLL